MPPRHAEASAKSGSENSSSESEEDDVIYVSSTSAPAPQQAQRPSAAPRVMPSYRVIGKKPAYACPNRHTAAHAAAALVLLRELRGVLGRVGAADAGLATRAGVREALRLLAPAPAARG